MTPKSPFPQGFMAQRQPSGVLVEITKDIRSICLVRIKIIFLLCTGSINLQENRGTSLQKMNK